MLMASLLAGAAASRHAAAATALTMSELMRSLFIVSILFES